MCCVTSIPFRRAPQAARPFHRDRAGRTPHEPLLGGVGYTRGKTATPSSALKWHELREIVGIEVQRNFGSSTLAASRGGRPQCAGFSRGRAASLNSFPCILLCEFPSLVPGHLGIAGLVMRVQGQIHSVNGNRDDDARQHESQESDQNGSNLRGVLDRPEIAVTDCGCRDK